MQTLALAGLGAPELLILLVVVLLFGASKLPDLARGSGQAMRIFKAETKEMRADHEPPVDPAPVNRTPVDQVREDLARGHDQTR